MALLPSKFQVIFSGKIPYFTTPPVREVSEHAEFGAIVSEWGKEFDVEAVFQNETTAVIAGLPSMADTSHVQMASTAPLAMDTNISMVHRYSTRVPDYSMIQF